MPDPRKYDDKQKFIEECLHQVNKVEREPLNKALGKCLGMWSGKKRKKCASELILKLYKRLIDLV